MKKRRETRRFAEKRRWNYGPVTWDPEPRKNNNFRLRRTILFCENIDREGNTSPSHTPTTPHLSLSLHALCPPVHPAPSPHRV